jgi:hypothetical protein
MTEKEAAEILAHRLGVAVDDIAMEGQTLIDYVEYLYLLEGRN